MQINVYLCVYVSFCVGIEKGSMGVLYWYLLLDKCFI